MIQLDGYYLYDLGARIRPLSSINDKSTYLNIWLPILIAKGALEDFITRSVYIHDIRTTISPAQKLLQLLNNLEEKSNNDEINNHNIIPIDVYQLTEALKAFETVLQEELGLTPMFLVTKKRGYDLFALIADGKCLFPDELQTKVPESIADANEGARCLAFELLTASGFHYHRANESVVLSYYDNLSGGKPKPTNRNLGAYITALEDEGAPSEIISCLRDLKNLHRNPLMHSGESIESVDEAIALLNAVHSAIVSMLKEFPDDP